MGQKDKKTESDSEIKITVPSLFLSVLEHFRCMLKW